MTKTILKHPGDYYFYKDCQGYEKFVWMDYKRNIREKYYGDKPLPTIEASKRLNEAFKKLVESIFSEKPFSYAYKIIGWLNGKIKKYKT